MDDTHPIIRDLLTRLIMERTPLQRMQMASDMFETAKQISLSGLKRLYPNASQKELRKRLFCRLYEHELKPAQTKKILDFIDGQDAL